MILQMGLICRIKKLWVSGKEHIRSSTCPAALGEGFSVAHRADALEHEFKIGGRGPRVLEDQSGEERGSLHYEDGESYVMNNGRS